MLQYANTRNAYHNQEKWMFEGEGVYGIPPLPPVDVPLDGCKFVRFDLALKAPHPELLIVHFFTDDWIFERIWRLPEKYLPILGKFRAVVAPDFSLYQDWPLMPNMWNHFRKHWLGAYWSAMGITVIPSPSWVLGSEECFSWCLDGEPEGSTICISSQAAIKGDVRKRQFEAGWATAMERLDPARVYLFGDMPESLHLDCPGELIHVENDIMLAKRRYCKRGKE